MTQVTEVLPEPLIGLVDRKFPGWEKLAYERHSEEALTLWIMGKDRVWNFYRASLSLDGRWTLSPCY